MVQKKQLNAGEIAEPKKRRRVGFVEIDDGVQASECIKIYLVSCKEQVGSEDSVAIDPVDLNVFFDDGEEKFYGYQDLKITVWVSCISFHVFADITFQSSSDRGKGITDLKSALQKIFGENVVEKKEHFLQSFLTDNHYIRSVVSDGEVLQARASACTSNPSLDSETSEIEVIRMVVSNKQFGHLYSRLVPLVLLLVDGSNPIDIDDPNWELYLLVQKTKDQDTTQYLLLGFAALYRFYHYPDSMRLRLSQILVLPPYQHKGHCRCLLGVLNNVAVSENVYELTIEEPVDSLQRIRTCIDTLRLLEFGPVQQAVDSVVSSMKQGKLSKKIQGSRVGAPADVAEDVRMTLKINKKQFHQCWEILIYLGLKPVDENVKDFKIFVSDRMKADIIGKNSERGKKVIDVPSEYNEGMSFVMFRAQPGAGSVQIDDNQASQEEQLQQLINERLTEIKSIAQKVSTCQALK